MVHRVVPVVVLIAPCFSAPFDVVTDEAIHIFLRSVVCVCVCLRRCSGGGSGSRSRFRRWRIEKQVAERTLAVILCCHSACGLRCAWTVSILVIETDASLRGMLASASSGAAKLRE